MNKKSTLIKLIGPVNEGFGDTTDDCPMCALEFDSIPAIAIVKCPGCGHTTFTCSMCEDKQCSDCPCEKK